MMPLAILHLQEAESDACRRPPSSPDPFCLYSVEDPSLGDDRTHIQGGFLYGLSLSGDILIGTPRVFFYGDSTSSLVTENYTECTGR